MSEECEQESCNCGGDDKAIITMFLAASIFMAMAIGFIASCEKESTIQYHQTERAKIEKGIK